MKVSIIIASYNYAKFIEEAINSVINQTYTDWELIIVDDGSSDNSVEIIKEYCQKDSRIKLFQHEADCEQWLKDKTTLLSETSSNASSQAGKNKGLKETLLLGLKHAKGDWIAFLESDDAYTPNNLSEKINIIEKYPNVKLIFNHVKYIDENPKSKRRMQSFTDTHKKLANMIFPRNMLYDFYVDNMILSFSCVMVKSDIIKNADFNTPNDARLDWWLWINIAYGNDFYYIDKRLTYWRLHSQSYINQSKIPKWYMLQMKAYEHVFKKHPDDKKLLLYNSRYKIKVYLIRGFRFFKNLPIRILDKIKNKF